MRCGRRDDLFSPDFPGEDTWREEGNPYHVSPSCSYCGSMTPEALFAAIEAGHKITPTDKSYKLYVEVPTEDPAALRVSGGTSSPERPEWGEPEQWHRYADLTDEQRAMLRRDGWGDGDDREGWVLIAPVGDRRHGKFYFQHLDEEGQQRFLDLVNDGKVNFGVPGYLYVRPYFARPA